MCILLEIFSNVGCNFIFVYQVIEVFYIIVFPLTFIFHYLLMPHLKMCILCFGFQSTSVFYNLHARYSKHIFIFRHEWASVRKKRHPHILGNLVSRHWSGLTLHVTKLPIEDKLLLLSGLLKQNLNHYWEVRSISGLARPLKNNGGHQ